MDRQCLPKNKVRPLTSEDIAIRRQQVRQKLAELAQQQQEQQTIAIVPEILEPKADPENKEDGPVFIAFARVFSGTLRRGQELYVLGPKYDPTTMMENAVDPSLTLKVKVSYIQ